MRVSENSLKWALRFYPPLFFQRVWVVKFDKGFRGVEVKIRKSIWNRNYNNSIFGGTIFAAADAFYPVLFFKALSLKGYNLRAWSKSVDIKYNKPSFTDLSYKISIDDAELAEAEEILNTVGKYTKVHPIEIYDKNGVNVASALNEVYMRNLDFIDPPMHTIINDDSFIKKGYTISTDKNLLDFDMIYHYLSKESYWSKGITVDRVRNSIENSMCFGIYDNGKQVGFARVVTDKAIFAYLCDVFVLDSHRGSGLSKWLLQKIRSHTELQGLKRWMLATADAHGLYKQFGFGQLTKPENWMDIYAPFKTD